MGDRAECRYDLFIAYAEAEGAWVHGYLLPALGLPDESIITRHSFQPGAPFAAEFERAVRDSRYTVLILSPAYLADEWSSLGEDLASHLTVIGRQQRLIPLLRKPCEVPLRLDFRVRLDCTERTNWDREMARLRVLLSQPEPRPETPRCPYPGMIPFKLDDARFFYGREAEIDQMLQCLRHQRFLMVIGDSGSGKSSLINAGLLPKLNASTFFSPGYWLVRTMRPGSQPLQTLSQIMESDLGQPAQAVANLLATHPPAQRLLLIIDQFEELFTQASQLDESQFIAVLKELRAAESCAVVIALRSDFFYTDLKGSDLWPIALSERLEIDPLCGEALRDAIVKPAAREGVYLEPGLIELLLKDAAGERGVLPLLQETMVRLWDRMERRFIPLRAYEQLGGGERSGLAGALVTKADATLDVLTQRSPYHETIAHHILLRLVQFGEGRPDTRRQQSESALRSWDDDPQVFDETLEHLAENRLLTLSGEEEDQDRKVDIAHEALFTEWPVLKERVRQWRQPEQVRRRLEGWAADWDHRNRDPKALLNEVELSQAKEWLDSSAAGELGCSEALRDLAKASQTALDAEAARQRNTRRFRQVALAAIMALIVVALGIGLWSSQRIARQEREAADVQSTLAAESKAYAEGQATARAEAEAQAQLATARYLVGEGGRVHEEQPLLGVRLALEGLRLAPPDAQQDLLAATQELVKKGRLVKLGNSIEAVFPSPDSSMVIIDHAHMFGEVLSVADGKVVEILTDSVEEVWFSPDPEASRFVVAYSDAPSELRDTVDGQVVEPLAGLVENVWFSQDPMVTYFVVGYPSSTELRCTTDGRLVGQFSRSVEEVWFSPDPGLTYFEVQYENVLHGLRRTADGQPVEWTSSWIDGVWYSQDPAATYLVVDYGNADGELRRTADGKLVKTLSTYVSRVWFSPELGHSHFVVSYIAEPSELRTTPNGKLVKRLTGDVSQVWFSPDPAGLFSVSYWRQLNESELRRTADGRVMETHTDFITQQWFSPDPPGNRYVVGYRDADGELRAAASGMVVEALTGDVDRVWFSADETAGRFVVDYIEGHADLRRAADGQLLETFTDRITQVWFSPDESASRFVIDYADVPGELRRSSDGKTVGPLSLEYLVSDVQFSPDAAASHFVVHYGPNRVELRRTVDGQAVAMTGPPMWMQFIPDPVETCVMVGYGDGRSELWAGQNDLRRLIVLELGLVKESPVFDGTSRRILVRYSNGPAYLLDLGWLAALGGNPGAFSAQELEQLACQGPFASGLFDEADLAGFLDGAQPQACR